MKVPFNLEKLASYFPSPLYVVGGAVRDYLIGSNYHDIDITSPLLADEVIALLKDTEFTVIPASSKLGTLIIKDGLFSFDYTAFRTDSYANDGSHAPTCITFTNDIELDAKRRDFSVNAIYYDIKNRNYADPLNGISDIKNKLIRSTREPHEVFKEDALRILRMVRLSCQLDFEIESNTFLAAKNLVKSISMLSYERIHDEFNKMLIADTFNGVKDAHYKAVKLLDDLGALEYIVPELTLGKGVEQKPEYHIYDVYGHIMSVFKHSKPSVRLAALLHDIAKPKLKMETGHMIGHDKEGAVMTREILKRLKYSNKDIDKTARLVENHMYDLKCETSEKKLRRFIVANYDIIDDLIDLKHADSMGGKHLNENPSALRLKATLDQMRLEEVPFTLKDLKVKGDDLISLNIPAVLRSEALKKLLLAAASGTLNDRDSQLSFLKTMNLF